MNNVTKVLFGGEIKALAGENGEMFISGWASTNGVDYSNEVVEPSAFVDTIDKYRKKGRLWFNHDHTQVLGKVLEIEIRENGLYISKAVLADTAYNRDYIFPLIRSGGLNEFSIQFRSMKGEYRGGVYHHTKCELLETSVVSIACNSEADITGFKSIPSVQEWKSMILSNTVEADEPVSTEPEQKTMETQNFTPDFSDLTVLAHDASKHFQNDEIKDMVSKKHVDYNAISDLLYVAKRGDTYLFKVADPVEKGFAYNFENVAVSFADALGVKGNYLVSTETRVALIKRFIEIYGLLEKRMPEIDNTPIDKLVDAELEAVKFSDLTFFEGEKDTVETKLLKNSFTAISNIVKHAKATDNKKLLSELNTAVKYMYAGIDVSLYFYPSSTDDIEALQTVLAMIAEYYDIAPVDPEEDSTETDTSSGIVYTMTADEKISACEKFRDFLDAKIKRHNEIKEASELLKNFSKSLE